MKHIGEKIQRHVDHLRDSAARLAEEATEVERAWGQRDWEWLRSNGILTARDVADLAAMYEVQARRLVEDGNGFPAGTWRTVHGLTGFASEAEAEDAAAEWLANDWPTREADAIQTRVRPSVRLLIDGEVECSLADFLADNEMPEDDGERLAVERLAPGESYTGGGGAWAEWTVRRLS